MLRVLRLIPADVTRAWVVASDGQYSVAFETASGIHGEVCVDSEAKARRLTIWLNNRPLRQAC
jgi:hypothetical protein